VSTMPNVAKPCHTVLHPTTPGRTLPHNHTLPHRKLSVSLLMAMGEARMFAGDPAEAVGYFAQVTTILVYYYITVLLYYCTTIRVDIYDYTTILLCYYTIIGYRPWATSRRGAWRY
jgi:hypothetical protein